MPWQDWIFSFGSGVFIFALFPSVLSKDKPALSTSIPTGGVLFCFALTYVTLELWLSAVVTFINALIWWIIAFQKYKVKKS